MESIQDRIKAFNQAKAGDLSSRIVPKVKKRESYPAREETKQTQTKSKSQEEEDPNSIYQTPNSAISILQKEDNLTIMMPNQPLNKPEVIYEAPISNKTLEDDKYPIIMDYTSGSADGHEHENDFSLYSDVPSNIPIGEMKYTEKVSLKDQDEQIKSENSSRFSPPKQDIPDKGFQDEDNTSDAGHYASPKDLPLFLEADPQERTMMPENIGSRWQRVRQTVKDPNLRTMVDMSLLTVDRSYGESFKRSASLATTELNAEIKSNSSIKRTSLPALNEFNRIEANRSPSLSKISPKLGRESRESSFKSTVSTESGNLSDVSDTTSTTSNEYGRPRNVSDVSITIGENNYITFQPTDEALLNNPNPNERVLVCVRGDKSYTGKILLSPEKDEQTK